MYIADLKPHIETGSSILTAGYLIIYGIQLMRFAISSKELTSKSDLRPARFPNP